jgi:Protein of unknown function (DUF1573)
MTIMKSMWLNLALLLSMATAARGVSATPPPPVVAPGGSAQVPGPRIHFPEPVYDFGRIMQGTIVKHEFVFTNTGDARLEIKGVYPSCGCTTPGEWSRAVEPGQAGTIPLEFNSGHFMGAVVKMVTVASNDKSQPAVYLQLKGTIWKPIDVNPPLAVLNAVADSPADATATVRIVNNLEQPLALMPPESNNRAFTTELKTVQPGKEYQLIIKTVPPLKAGNVQGQIKIKTSSKDAPMLTVTALAMIQQAVVVAPSQILLSANAGDRPFVRVISIRNNEPEPLTLSDPSVNAQGVDIQMKAIQPGRQFTLTLTFPGGFQVNAGENVELSVKSSNPRFQLIKVPVVAPMRPRPVSQAAPVSRTIGRP